MDIIKFVVLYILAAIGCFTIGALIATAQAVTTLEVIIPEPQISATSTSVGVTASVRCTNENFDTSPRCQSPVDVNTFRMIDEAHFDGYLLSGVYFEQKPVAKSFVKMTVEDAFWYIDSKGRFEAESDVQALSIHLTR